MPGFSGDSTRQINPREQKRTEADQPHAHNVDPSTPDLPDVNPRFARIAELQRAIAAGDYAIPAGAVAEKVIERLIRQSAETAQPDSARREGNKS